MVDRIIPPRRGELLTPDGRGTVRLHEFLERITGTTNDSSAAVDAQIIQNLSAAVFALQVQIGSGNFLTSDSDSFTVDSDILFVDQTEA
jgi:hypothetical protein